MALKQIFEQEKKAQKPFWDAWKKEKNVFKQMFLLEMYPTFMLPMRCWVLCPYPTPVAIILSASPLIAMEHFPGYGEDSLLLRVFRAITRDAGVLHPVVLDPGRQAHAVRSFLWRKEHCSIFWESRHSIAHVYGCHRGRGNRPRR